MKVHLLAAFAVLFAGVSPRQPAAAAAAGFVVVVNAENATPSLPRATVAKIFLHRSGWPSGAPARPVDQLERSTARVEFTKVVHGKSVSAIKAYWQQRIFTGQDVPPVEKPSDAEVLAYVQANRDAIGYVASGTELPRGVRALTLDD